MKGIANRQNTLIKRKPMPFGVGGNPVGRDQRTHPKTGCLFVGKNRQRRENRKDSGDATEVETRPNDVDESDSGESPDSNADCHEDDLLMT